MLIIMCYVTIINVKEARVFRKRRESSIIIPAALHEKICQSCKPIVEDVCEVSDVRIRKASNPTNAAKIRRDVGTFRFVSGS